jgi:hypothetical protein
MSTPTVAIEKRDPLIQAVLCLVTCGLYGWYWIFKTNDPVNAASNHPEAPNGTMVLVYILVTCGIYGLIWYYNLGKRIEEIKAARGQTSGGNTAVLYLVLALFLPPAVIFLAQQELNSFAEE